MLDLALSVFFSSLIFVIFKLYGVYHVHTLNAIVVNYITACSVGFLYYDGPLALSDLPDRSWLTGAMLLGVLFIIVFNIMARTSQQLGVSVASVATKMSLVIPVVLGVWLYHEQLGFIKLFGIALALAAVYFASVKPGVKGLQKNSLILPILLFLGSGIIDASIKFLEEQYVGAEEFPIFSASVFGAAAISGLIYLSIKSTRQKVQWQAKDLLGGVALGIPNFFSIYFLLRALQNEFLNSASIFTINNVAIVMFSTLLGITLFKEQVTYRNWAGIGMAVVSIVLVALF